LSHVPAKDDDRTNTDAGIGEQTSRQTHGYMKGGSSSINNLLRVVVGGCAQAEEPLTLMLAARTLARKH
jgi:hypothetical protein